MKKIIITSGKLSLQAELNNGPTAQKVWEQLPIQGEVNTWGDEIYFEIPIPMEKEYDARADVEVGELGYWPLGRAFCIFFGPTPASTDQRPRAYSPVNILGRVMGDVTLFKSLRNGDTIKIDVA